MVEQVFGTGLKAQGDDQGVISVERPPGEQIWSSRERGDGHCKAITSLAWSHDGRYLASGSADTTIKIWDAVTGKVLQTYTGHAAEVRALAWSPEDSRIVSSADHENLHLWMPFCSEGN
jgi:WD40 repeat protein